MIEMRFWLCLKCRHAWFGTIAPCCGEDALDCNPWGADGRAWYQARVNHKAPAIWEVLTSDQRAKRRSLLKGIRAKGNDGFRARAA